MDSRHTNRFWTRWGLVGGVVLSLLFALTAETYAGCAAGAGGRYNNVAVPCTSPPPPPPRTYHTPWHITRPRRPSPPPEPAYRTRARIDIADAEKAFGRGTVEGYKRALSILWVVFNSSLTSDTSSAGTQMLHRARVIRAWAQSKLGKAAIDRKAYAAAKGWMQRAAKSGVAKYERYARRMLREIEPFVQREKVLRPNTQQGRAVVARALRQEPAIAPDRAAASQKAWQRENSALAGELKGGAERPPRKAGRSSSFFGTEGSRGQEKAGLVEQGSKEPNRMKTVDQQLRSARHHARRADRAAKGGDRQTAHREASRGFDRRGRTVNDEKVEIPAVGASGPVIVDTRGIVRRVPEALAKHKDWQELSGRAAKLRANISRREKKIATLNHQYEREKAAAPTAQVGRLMVKIALEKQRASRDTHKLADVKRRQEEMLDSFSVDFSTQKNAAKGAETDLNQPEGGKRAKGVP